RPRPSGTRSVSEAPPGTFGRATAALAAETLARAPRRVDGPPGMVAVVDPRWPDSHDSNKVLVSGPVASAQLVAFADDALGWAGVAYRQLLLLHGGAELAGAVADAGYQPTTILLMARSTQDVAPPEVEVRAVDEPTAREVVRAGWRASSPDMSEETVE